jgi:hypothetical protein
VGDLSEYNAELTRFRHTLDDRGYRERRDGRFEPVGHDGPTVVVVNTVDGPRAYIDCGGTDIHDRIAQLHYRLDQDRLLEVCEQRAKRITELELEAEARREELDRVYDMAHRGSAVARLFRYACDDFMRGNAEQARQRVEAALAAEMCSDEGLAEGLALYLQRNPRVALAVGRALGETKTNDVPTLQVALRVQCIVAEYFGAQVAELQADNEVRVTAAGAMADAIIAFMEAIRSELHGEALVALEALKTQLAEARAAWTAEAPRG